MLFTSQVSSFALINGEILDVFLEYFASLLEVYDTTLVIYELVHKRVAVFQLNANSLSFVC
jgi:hypothetical protein